MIYILAAILIFGVLIALHELGHFCAAKACGVRVNEFSIGMGRMEKCLSSYMSQKAQLLWLQP